MNLFSPTRTPSLCRPLVIVDDFTRFMCFAFLATKHEALNNLLNFTEKFKMKRVSQIKIRSDHDGEFENEPLKGCFDENGIAHFFSSKSTTTKWGQIT